MDDPISESDKNKYIIILQNFCDLRTGQDHVLWSIFGAFWGTNALLLVSLFATDESWNQRNVGILLSSIGITISIIWIIIQFRALARIAMYEKSIKSIEKKILVLPKNLRFSRKSTSKIPISARLAMKICSAIAFFGWVASLIYFKSQCF